MFLSLILVLVSKRYCRLSFYLCVPVLERKQAVRYFTTYIAAAKLFSATLIYLSRLSSSVNDKTVKYV